MFKKAHAPLAKPVCESTCVDWKPRTIFGGCYLVFTLAALPALAGAPITSPEPVRKTFEVSEANDGRIETIDTSSEVNSEQARELLMQQLMRAAEAGIVQLRPTDDEALVGDNAGATESQPESIEDAGAASTGDLSPTELVPSASGGSDGAKPGEVATEDFVVDPAEVAELASRIKTSGLGEEELPKPVAVLDPEMPVADVVPTVPTRAPAKCFSRAQITLPDVLAGQHLAISIGEQRKALVGEFDTANPEPALTLAKTYLAVGMIQEARVVIDEFAPNHPLGQFLLDVANVWLGKDVEPDGSLYKDDCIGVQALWRAYAQARKGNHESALKSEISSGAALEELPLHPRQVVASELGLAAAKQGEWDSARRLSAMAIRAADGEGEVLGKTHLLSFRLAKWRSEPEEAKHHLALAGSADTDTATEALLIRAEETLRSEDVLNGAQTALQMDLGALARREIGTDIAKRAFELEARLFHRSAGADETIDFLSDAVDLGLLNADQHSSFLSELISKPAFSDVARPLAHIYLEDPERFNGAMEQAALRRSLIRSLAAEGVPGVAKSLVRGGDLVDPELAAELAQSFVNAEEYREAIAAISKTDDGVLQRLILSEAFLGMGDFEKAIAVLVEMPANLVLTDEDKTRVSAARMEAELAGRDFASAYATATEQLARSSDPSLAAQSALFALEGGADVVPAQVRQAFSEEEDSDFIQIEEIYPINGPDLLTDDQTLESLQESLDRIQSSEEVILEIIENG